MKSNFAFRNTPPEPTVDVPLGSGKIEIETQKIYQIKVEPTMVSHLGNKAITDEIRWHATNEEMTTNFLMTTGAGTLETYRIAPDSDNLTSVRFYPRIYTSSVNSVSDVLNAYGSVRSEIDLTVTCIPE
ncbi:hypothetical protein [Vibrio campbellii]|uniref:hypothetical protein n=1 Tax=Vibrio campbellii TaxID=680 RepID=UPI000CD36011|nr:hypothetical protein [Vibrio campbellii]AUW07371.1 hypothetical protein C1N51_27290 [Vibrio campbellii]